MTESPPIKFTGVPLKFTGAPLLFTGGPVSVVLTVAVSINIYFELINISIAES